MELTFSTLKYLNEKVLMVAGITSILTFGILGYLNGYRLYAGIDLIGVIAAIAIISYNEAEP